MPSPPSSRPSLPRRGPWLALLSVIVIGAMPFMVCPRLEQARAETQAEEALGELASCLGTPRDDATLRARAVTAQLRGVDWPTRCGEAAARLEVALAALQRRHPPQCGGRCCEGETTCATAQSSREALAVLRESLRGGLFDGQAATRLFGASAPLLTAPALPSADLPEAATLPTPGEGGALARGGYDVSALVRAEGGAWRLLLHARDKHAIVCDVDPATATARCAPLAPAIPIADTVLLVDGAPDAPLTVLARESDAVAPERWAIYDARSGARRLALEHDALGATVAPDGKTAALVDDGAGYFVVSEGTDALPVGEGGGRSLGPPLLFGSRLVSAQTTSGEVRLRARSLRWEDGTLAIGDGEPIADVPGWSPAAVTMQACRSPELTAIAVAAEPPEPEPEVLVALHDGEAWHPARATLASPWFGLACDDEGVTLTDVTEGAATDRPGGVRSTQQLVQQRCTIAGCSRQLGRLEVTRWRRASRYLAAGLGEAALLVWRSALGDVRFVVGPPRALGSATPRSLFEGDDHGGFDYDRHGAELIARDGQALLLVADEHAGSIGTHGFVLDAEGGVRPLAVDRARGY